jgi:hypothetical protein
MTAQPSTTMLVYRLNVAASSHEAGQPGPGPAPGAGLGGQHRPQQGPRARCDQRGFGEGRHVITPGEQDRRTTGSSTGRRRPRRRTCPASACRRRTSPGRRRRTSPGRPARHIKAVPAGSGRAHGSGRPARCRHGSGRALSKARPQRSSSGTGSCLAEPTSACPGRWPSGTEPQITDRDHSDQVGPHPLSAGKSHARVIEIRQLTDVSRCDLQHHFSCNRRRALQDVAGLPGSSRAK